MSLCSLTYKRSLLFPIGAPCQLVHPKKLLFQGIIIRQLNSPSCFKNAQGPISNSPLSGGISTKARFTNS